MISGRWRTLKRFEKNYFSHGTHTLRLIPINLIRGNGQTPSNRRPLVALVFLQGALSTRNSLIKCRKCVIYLFARFGLSLSPSSISDSFWRVLINRSRILLGLCMHRSSANVQLNMGGDLSKTTTQRETHVWHRRMLELSVPKQLIGWNIEWLSVGKTVEAVCECTCLHQSYFRKVSVSPIWTKTQL